MVGGWVGEEVGVVVDVVVVEVVGGFFLVKVFEGVGLEDVVY